MHRALVITGVMLAGLAAAAPASAREVEREVTFTLRAEGFTVLLDTTDNDGEGTAYLAFSRGGQTASYITPAKVTADTVEARFGHLGELRYSYAAKHGSTVECDGEGKARFEGTFTFTGENGYVHLDADRADGAYQDYSPAGCPQDRRLRRAVPYTPSYGDEGATLAATAGSRRRGVIREVRAYDPGGAGRHKVGLLAVLAERREGMTVQRGVQRTGGADAFSWNLDKGTATLRPPAPFIGSAVFTRHGRDGHGTWTGSLGMPILGGEPVQLAGPEFRAYLHKGVPQDE